MSEQDLLDTRDKASYCLGVETGRGLKMQFADLNMNLFWQGMQGAFGGQSLKISEEELRQVVGAIRQQMVHQQRQMLAKMSEENKKNAEAFLEQNKMKPGVKTLSSGLQYRIIREQDSGKSPTLLDAVTIHYKASFPSGAVFETTYEKNQPKTLSIGQMIPGWAEAIKLMKVGEKWEIYLPPYLAYGEGGVPPNIPPNALLIFEIELLGIKEEGVL